MQLTLDINLIAIAVAIAFCGLMLGSLKDTLREFRSAIHGFADQGRHNELQTALSSIEHELSKIRAALSPIEGTTDDEEGRSVMHRLNVIANALESRRR